MDYLIERYQVNASSSTEIIISAVLVEDTFLQCGVYTLRNTPTTTNNIVFQNHYNHSKRGEAVLRIGSLTPQTKYKVYCITKESTGMVTTSYRRMLEESKTVTTPCCHTVYINLLQTIQYYNSPAINILEVKWSSLPVGTLGIDLSTSYEGMLHGVRPFLPRSFAINAATKDTRLLASLPSLLDPGTYALNVSLTGTDRKYYTIVYPRSSSFQVLDTSNVNEPYIPIFVKCVFANDGTHVRCNFDTVTNQGSLANSFVCSSLLHFRSASAYTCRWLDPATILIYSDSSYRLDVGDVITLRDNMVRAKCMGEDTNACAQWPAAVATNVTVTNAVSPVIPKVVISSSSVIGPCDLFVLDLTSSIGSGGRNWKTVIVDVSSPTAITSRLKDFFKTSYAVVPPTPVPEGLFKASNTYTIKISLCNFMGGCSVQTSHTVRVQPLSEGSTVPSLSVIGPVTRRIRRKQSLSLSAIASVDLCLGKAFTSHMLYDWRLYNDNVEVSSIRSESNRPTVYFLSGNTLDVNSVYEVRLRVTYALSGLSATRTVEVYVDPSNVVALISGGSTRTVPSGKNFVLDASASYDEDVSGYTGTRAGLSFKWQCTLLSPLVPDFCGLNFPAVTTTEKITASAKGITYVDSVSVVTVIVYEGDRVDEASVQVTITPSTTPLVKVLTPRQKVRADQKIDLLASVELYAPATVSWSVDNTSLNMNAITLSRASQSLGIGMHTINLAVKANIASPGSILTFTLASGASKQSVVIEYLSPPFGGLVAISPSTGTELLTMYTLSATDWSVQQTSSELPITYSFSYRSEDKSTSLNIQGRSELAYTTTQLPKGADDDGYRVLTQVRIFNALDASRLVTKNVIVGRTTKTRTEVSNSIVTSITTSKEETNLDELLRVISVSATVINRVDCSHAPDCVALNRHLCMATAHTCGRCRFGYVADPLWDANTTCRALLTSAPETSYSGKACRSTSDCGTLLQCNSSSGRCVAPLKSCGGGCLNGHCEYRSKSTGKVLNTCLEGDYTCRAQCVCDAGYSGASCSVTIEDLAERRALRDILVDALTDFAGSGSRDFEYEATMVSSLSALAVKMEELTVSSCNQILDMTVSTVTSALSSSLFYDDVVAIVAVMDVCSELVYASSVPAAISISQGQRALLTVPAVSTMTATSAVLDNLLNLYGNLISQGVVAGQEDVYTYADNFRLQNAVLSGTDDSPQMLCPSASCGSSSNPAANVDMQVVGNPGSTFAVTVIETASKLYSSTVSLNSNPLRINIQSSDLYDSTIYIRYTLVNHEPQYYFGAEVERAASNDTEMFVTFCKNGAIFTDVMTCRTGVVLQHDCNGTEIVKSTPCPDTYLYPLCVVLSDTHSAPTSPCRIVNYTVTTTQCECEVTVSDAVLSTYSLEVGSSSAMTYDTPTTVVSHANYDDELSLGEGSYVAAMVGVYWAVGIILLYFFCWRHRSQQMNRVAVVDSKAVSGGSPQKSPKKLVIEYINQLLPGSFMSYDKSWSQWCLVLVEHHRYLKIFFNATDTRIRDSHSSMDRIRLKLLGQMMTYQTVSALIVAVLYKLQVLMCLPFNGDLPIDVMCILKRPTNMPFRIVLCSKVP